MRERSLRFKLSLLAVMTASLIACSNAAKAEDAVIRRPPAPQSVAPKHEGSSRSVEVPNKSNQAKDGGRTDDTSARIPLKTDEWNKWKENVLPLISDRFNKFRSSKTFSSIPGNTSCEVTFVVSESGEISFPLVSRNSGTPQFDGLAAASIMSLSTHRSFSFPLKSGVHYLQCTIDFSSKDGPSNLSMKATDALPPRNVHRIGPWKQQGAIDYSHTPPDIVAPDTNKELNL